MPKHPKPSKGQIFVFFASEDPGYGAIFLIDESRLSKEEIVILGKWEHVFEEEEIMTNEEQKRWHGDSIKFL